MDIRLKHRYEDERRIMKHVSEMTEEENNEFNRLVEIERVKLINQLERRLHNLKYEKEEFYTNETLNYERLVKENNNHFCVCGFRCLRGMGKTKFKCGKQTCKLYEHK